MNIYRWSFLSMRYLKLHAPTTVIRGIELRTRKDRKRIMCAEKERITVN
jgi:hypothetical protein